MTDPDEVRAQQRARWEAAAERWDKQIDPFYAASQPVSDWLLSKLDAAPGDRILELAAGRGDLSLALAERVGPEGNILCTDGAEALVEVCRRRAAEAGAEIECRQMELEWVDADAASLDAVICRFGYMLCVDPEAALRETRRVLRSGGRLALAVWDLPAENTWLSAVPEEAILAGHIPKPDPDTPNPFKLSAPGALAEVLAASGFIEPVIEAVPITLPAPSLDAFWDASLELSDIMRAILSGLTPAEHYTFRDAVEARWAPFVQSDGSVAVPGRALCAFAEA